MSAARLFGRNGLAFAKVHFSTLVRQQVVKAGIAGSTSSSSGSSSSSAQDILRLNPLLMHNRLQQLVTLRNFDRNLNYFEVFRLNRDYDVDLSKLSHEYKALQKVLHPDKFANKSEEDIEKSTEYSSLVNRAYQTLLDPHKRGIYLLRLAGKKISEDESEVQLDAQFLENVMEINEELARRELSKKELEKVKDENAIKLNATIRRVSMAFAAGDLDGAKQALAELKFYKNVAEKTKELS